MCKKMIGSACPSGSGAGPKYDALQSVAYEGMPMKVTPSATFFPEVTPHMRSVRSRMCSSSSPMSLVPTTSPQSSTATPLSNASSSPIAWERPDSPLLASSPPPFRLPPGLCQEPYRMDVVKLIRQPGMRLGIAGVPVNVCGFSGVYVKNIEAGGFLDAHNRTCARSRRVNVGDCIVRIDDEALGALPLMERMSQVGKMKVTVLRQVGLTEREGFEPGFVRLREAAEGLDLSVPSEESTAFGSETSSLLELSPPTSPTAAAVMPKAGGGDVDAVQKPVLSELMAPAEPAEAAEPAAAELAEEAKPAAKAKAGRKKKAKGQALTDSKPTTLMLRQLPPDFKRDLLLEILDSNGFAGLYDFVYMPMNLRTQTPFTYAFVNMVNSEVAEDCQKRLDGFSDWSYSHDKACLVSWADSEQGLAANIERYRNSPVMHESVDDGCKPVIFQDGVRMPFPAPTKTLKVPPTRKPAASAKDEDAAANEDDELTPAADGTMCKILTGKSDCGTMTKLLTGKSEASTADTECARDDLDVLEVLCE